MNKETAKLYRLTEDDARALLERVRWPNGPVCPHCGSTKVMVLSGKSSRPGLKKCKACRKQFTVTVGTIFHGSHIALRDWVYAFARICASKKGVSALQLQRELGLTYKSAWFMAHRIRYAMRSEPLRTKLAGIIEADETFVGGKPRGRPWRHGDPVKPRAVWSSKTPVVALVERGGRVKSRVVCDVRANTLNEVICDAVDPSRSTLMTDERSGYRKVGRKFSGGHKSVCHQAHEYFRHSDGAGVNSVESYFALLKRGVYGTFHHVSKRHLQRYCDEFDFRWNHRDVSDHERALVALGTTEGKRLMYRTPTGRSA